MTQLLSNMQFRDSPVKVGRYAWFLNQNNATVYPQTADGRAAPVNHSAIEDAAKLALKQNAVLVIEDERYFGIDVQPRVDYLRGLMEPAIKARCPVMLYGRPGQNQYAVSGYAKKYKERMASNDWHGLYISPEYAAYQKWRDNNTMELNAGLYEGVAAAMVEFRMYLHAFDVRDIIPYTIAEARRMNVPVCPFIDFRYPDYGGIENAGPEEAKWMNQFIPLDTLELMLRLFKAEGVEYFCPWMGQAEPLTKDWQDRIDLIDATFPAAVVR